MERKGKDSIAVEPMTAVFGKEIFGDLTIKEGFDLIPMWVADMNFPTVPTITEAIMERVAHPAFGYFSPTEEFYDAIIRWHKRKHGAQEITKECIGYQNTVLGGFISAHRNSRCIPQ